MWLSYIRQRLALALASPGRVAIIPVVMILAGILLVMPLLDGGTVIGAWSELATTPVTTVSAASFESLPVAPSSIVSAFGANLATQTIAGTDLDPVTPGIQLPTTLGGSTVEVNGRRAELLFVSPAQINYIVPTATEAGAATVQVRSGDGTVSTGTVDIALVAPAIFSANASGTGPAAALLIRVSADGRQSYESVAEYNQQLGRFLPRPIDLGPEGERVFLVLFLSGLRRATDTNGDGNLNETIRLLIGGTEIAPLYAGAQPEFIGLDQINAEIPRDLIGRGIVSIAATAPNFESSNLVEMEIAGLNTTSGISAPVVTGFDGNSALAGQQLTINGSGFSPVIEQNVVRISGLDADVISASTTQLKVEVPYGVTSGTVLVRTQSGEGRSSSVLSVRTSISGVLEDTLRQPISGMTIRLADTVIAARTNDDGAFVLADVPVGVHSVEVDGPSLSLSPPYPSISLKVAAQANRDNQFPRVIALQQSNGSSATIGSSTIGSVPPASGAALNRESDAEQANTLIQTGQITLEVPAGAKALFPDGTTSGSIYLTQLENGRTSVNLPVGYYSSDIVQITPFNVTIDPGAKLTFPNSSGLAAGAKMALFRFSAADGRFVRESALATVTADGQSVETGVNAIRVTSIYFVAPLRRTTTINGRVFESNGTTPVRGALARFRGQESLTDGTGSYILRSVPVSVGEKLNVEISVVRSNGRVDRAAGVDSPAVLGGVTRVAAVRMPPRTSNRVPIIQGAPQVLALESRTVTHPLIIFDPDIGPDAVQTLEVSLDAPPFVSLVKPTTGRIYSLRITPGFSDAGNWNLLVTARDSEGGVTTKPIALTVRNVNRPPVARDLTVSGTEDTELMITLQGDDSDPGDTLSYSIAIQPIRGTLTGSDKIRVYTPSPNYNGFDKFTYRVSDGDLISAFATVTINIAAVNDPPVLTLPADQTVTQGKLVSLRVTASDPDIGQTLTISAGSVPIGAAFRQTANTGLLTWTPTANQIGRYTFTFTVTDSANPPASASGSVVVNVVR
jgi:uncharacterized protein (TIGR03437 family)